MLVTATNELKFHQWPNDGPEEPYNLGITSEIVSLSLSKDNKYAIFLQEGGRPEILSIKDVNNIKPIHVVTAIDNASVVLFQRQTKRTVAIGTSCATVALYDTKTKSIGKLYTVSAAVECLDFNADDEFLCAACANGVLSLLNVRDEAEACSYSIGYAPTCISFHHSNQNLFAAGTKEGSLFVFDINEPTPSYVVKSHLMSVNSLTFIFDSIKLITVASDNKFCVHDLDQRDCIFKGYLQYPLTSIDITSDGKHIAIGTENGNIFIYETKNYLTPLFNLKAHDSKITHVKFSNGGHNFENSESSDMGSTTITSGDLIREENDFDSLYCKFINKVDADETLRLFKQDIVRDIIIDADKLYLGMISQMANLNEFIKNEFNKMTSQLDIKWDLLNIIMKSYGSKFETRFKGGMWFQDRLNKGKEDFKHRKGRKM